MREFNPYALSQEASVLATKIERAERTINTSANATTVKIAESKLPGLRRKLAEAREAIAVRDTLVAKLAAEDAARDPVKFAAPLADDDDGTIPAFLRRAKPKAGKSTSPDG